MGYPGYQTLPRKTGTQGKDGDAAAERDLNLYGGVLTEKICPAPEFLPSNDTRF